MKNKCYKIRNKITNEFISLGYKSKSTWLSFPSQAIKYGRLDYDDYEVVVFEYKEINVLPLNK